MADLHVGDVVVYKGKEDAVILHEEAPLGFRVFTLLILDSGATVTSHRLDIEEKQVNFLNEFVLGDDLEEQTTLQHGEKVQRFATVTEDDIDDLRQEKTSKSTNYQTNWGVKVLRGKHFC